MYIQIFKSHLSFMGLVSSAANTWTYRIRAVMDNYNPSTHSLTMSWTRQSRFAFHFSTHSRQGKGIKSRMHPLHEINIEIIKPHQKVYTCMDLTHRAPQFTLLLYILSSVLVFPFKGCPSIPQGRALLHGSFILSMN